MIYCIERHVRRTWLHNVMSFGIVRLFSDVDAKQFNTIVLRFDCSKSMMEQGTFGYFSVDEDEGELYIHAHEKLNKENLTRTIFHEMVHLKQLITGRWDPERLTWEGQVYDCAYSERPWEIEAFEQEDLLYAEYCNVIE